MAASSKYMATAYPLLTAKHGKALVYYGDDALARGDLYAYRVPKHEAKAADWFRRAAAATDPELREAMQQRGDAERRYARALKAYANALAAHHAHYDAIEAALEAGDDDEQPDRMEDDQ